jgi:hypothetical protein
MTPLLYAVIGLVAVNVLAVLVIARLGRSLHRTEGRFELVARRLRTRRGKYRSDDEAARARLRAGGPPRAGR